MWLLLAPAAFASPEVAVVGLHIPGLDAAASREVSVDLAQALSATGNMEGVGPDTISTRLAGREDLVLEAFALSEGRDLLDQGRVLYANADPDAALGMLQGAVEVLEGGASISGDPSELVEAYLTLGLALSGLGETAQAQEALAKAAVLAPRRELDTLTYPPDVIEAFEAAKAAQVEAGTGTLAIRAPKGSKVLVDGLPADAEMVTGLPPGRHYVYVEGTEGARYVEATEVSAGRSTTVNVKLDMSLAEASDDANLHMRQTDSLYRAVGAYAQTPLVFLGGQVGDQVVLALYSSRSGNFSQSLSAPAGEDPVLALQSLVPAMGSYVTGTGDIRPDRVAFDVPALAPNDNALLSEMLLTPSAAAVATTPQETGPSVSKEGPRWGLWAGVGGLALLGAGAGTYALVSSEPQDQGTITLGPIP